MARINKLSTELFSLGTYSVSLNNDNLYDWTIKIIRCVKRVHCILPFKVTLLNFDLVWLLCSTAVEF